MHLAEYHIVHICSLSYINKLIVTQFLYLIESKENIRSYRYIVYR